MPISAIYALINKVLNTQYNIDRLTTTPTQNKFGTKVLLLIMIHLYMNNIHCKWHSIPPMRFSATCVQRKSIVYKLGYL